MQETVYKVDQKTGHVKLPDFLGKDTVLLGAGVYQPGVGGLHSKHDKKVCHVASEDELIYDIDAASFYPSIMLQCGLFPVGIGPKFLDEYWRIYRQRLDAKRSGDKTTADVLKISLNGSFGKTASRWSPMYSPDVMLAITLTGQLTLLSLIERVEAVGATTLSANTDGIAVRISASKLKDLQGAVSELADLTKFEFEYTQYRALAMKDVNNYIAVKMDRSVKTKGLYVAPGLNKNPTAHICSIAVQRWLSEGVSIWETIRNGDLTDFISARSVTGGAVQAEEYLGKVVRWYMTTDDSIGPITYWKNGNLVPKTTGARACMNLPTAVPADLNYKWYMTEAVKIASDIGCYDFLTDEEKELIKKPTKKRKEK
jgi:hypothetical protein